MSAARLELERSVLRSLIAAKRSRSAEEFKEALRAARRAIKPALDALERSAPHARNAGGAVKSTGGQFR